EQAAFGLRWPRQRPAGPRLPGSLLNPRRRRLPRLCERPRRLALQRPAHGRRCRDEICRRPPPPPAGAGAGRRQL
ncbi:MAG: FIG01095463: hypothetical protein, partial [uncultured Sphingosinicella sp.]